MSYALFLSLVLSAQAGDNGAVKPGCTSPREVVTGWLSNLQAGREDVVAAGRCMALPPDMSPAQGQKALAELKRVVDARGILLRPDAMPDSPDYRDPRTNDARYLPVPSMTEVELVLTNSGWAFSPSTLRSARRLHDETFVFDLKHLAERLPSWMTRPILGVAGWQVLSIIVLMMLGAVVRTFVLAIAIGQLKSVVRRFSLEWSDEVLVPAAKPLGLLVMAAVVAAGLPLVGLPAGFAAILGLAVRTVAASSVVLVIYRLVDVLAETMQRRAEKTDTKLDDQLVPLVRRALKIATVAIGAVFVLQNLQIDVASLIAGLGLGGLAFALAAKDTISHVFGSVTIFLDKPFQIGDWVVTCGVEGIVEEVGFRTTRVRTFYNSLVSVPNGKLTDAIIDNYGMRKYRRTSTTLSLTYDTTPEQMEAFCNGVRAIIAAHPQTRKDYYEVHFAGYGAASLDVMLYFFFEVGTWSEELRARHEVYLDIWRLARALHVQFAFPTQTLHIASQATPTPMPESSVPDAAALAAAFGAFGPGGKNVVPPGPRATPTYFAGTYKIGGDG